MFLCIFLLSVSTWTREGGRGQPNVYTCKEGWKDRGATSWGEGEVSYALFRKLKKCPAWEKNDLIVLIYGLNSHQKCCFKLL